VLSQVETRQVVGKISSMRDAGSSGSSQPATSVSQPRKTERSSGRLGPGPRT